MELVYEMTFRAEVGEALPVGDTPMGNRLVIPVTGGWAKGPRINGTIVGSAADWAVLGTDGYARLDVRGQLQTDDGALLYVAYPGVMELTEQVTAVMLGGGETGFDDQYFRTTPRVETGDERYAWVNHTVFVSRGRLVEGGVEYEVCRVT